MLGSRHRRSTRPLAAVLALVLSAGVAVGLAAPAQAHDGGHVLIFTKTTAFRHTDAITKGTPLITAALQAEDFEVVHTENSAIFNDTDLAAFDAIIMFQTSGDPWTAAQKAALERYQRAGGGIVAIHNATDMRGNYTWWDNLVGALMPGHADTGSDPGQRGTVRIEDPSHPSTEHFNGSRWQRADEWYNYSKNVRGTAHVLASLDETTYTPGGNAMGYDHPISWCKPYDGGRAWVTGMGHYGSHYAEPAFMAHIVGGVKWAAGLEAGDCGGTVWDSFEKVALDQNTSAPFAMDVADDGRVFYTELVRGQVRVWDPKTKNVTTALTLDVYSGGEDGLLGIALDPAFTTNGRVYLYRSPNAPNNSSASSFFNRVSRFTMRNGVIDPASEELILEVPARRLPDEPGHTGGGLDFDAAGNLYLGVGDDVNPHSEPSGGYAPLSNRSGTFHDARETAANTNDLRGKLLRIKPNPTGPGYTIPAGNLFPEANDTGNKTRPEIYAMGFRNPFRFSVDQETGYISLADYSPDNGTDALSTRGPAGISEWNYIKSPGNYGWPLCMGNNEPFRNVDYKTNPVTVGANFNCANPVNDSPRNTGLTQLPPVRAADMWYGYQRSSVPQVIPQGGNLAPMGGPVYNFDPQLASGTKFPASYDGKPFFYEWARNKMFSIQLKNPAASSGSQVEKVTPFLPQEQFLAPIDSKFGPDGSLYVLDWGGGFGRDNPNSGLHRIDYISGSRSPMARITVDRDAGPAPLTVTFNGSGSTDPENAPLTYAWDFDGNGTVDATTAQPTYIYRTAGVFNARLTVRDPDGQTATTTVPITVGNTRPTVQVHAAAERLVLRLRRQPLVERRRDRPRGRHGVGVLSHHPARSRARRARPPDDAADRLHRDHRDKSRRARSRREHLLRAGRPLHRPRRRGRGEPAHGVADHARVPEGQAGRVLRLVAERHDRSQQRRRGCRRRPGGRGWQRGMGALRSRELLPDRRARAPRLGGGRGWLDRAAQRFRRRDAPRDRHGAGDRIHPVRRCRGRCAGLPAGEPRPVPRVPGDADQAQLPRGDRSGLVAQPVAAGRDHLTRGGSRRSSPVRTSPSRPRPRAPPSRRSSSSSTDSRSGST